MARHEFLRPHLLHEQRVLWMALASGSPAILTSLMILWLGDYTPKVQWTLTLAIVGIWLGVCFALRERVVSPLRTLANLLEAMREGDYSIRARGSKSDDAMGEVIQQVNAMSATLRAQRLGALEATTLLRKVMEEINVAVFAFDSEHRLRLVNRAGERMLNEPAERILGTDAESAGPGRNTSTVIRSERSSALSLRNRPLGHQPQHISRRRASASAAGGHRPHASVARRGAESLAAPGARARTRAE